MNRLTPCVKKCELDSSKEFCLWCKRTIDQIKNWRIYSEKERLKIMGNLKGE